MKIYFVPAFEGYIWSFPRPNHTSYGLITRSLPGWTVRAKMLLSNESLTVFGVPLHTEISTPVVLAVVGSLVALSIIASLLFPEKKQREHRG